MANRKIFLFVLILIAMLLLLHHVNWVMEWTIIGVFRQCPVKVLVIGLVSYFALYYTWLKNILHRLLQVFASSTLYNWGSGKDFKDSVSQNLRSSARSLGELIKSGQRGKRLKRVRHATSLVSLNSGQKHKLSLLSKKKNKVKTLRSKKHAFS
jgi:hypothetical protein